MSEAKKQRRDEILYRMVIERMIELRSEHKHTQEYVIANTGLDIPHFETGRDFPTLTSIAIFCKLYKITLAEFFDPLNYPPND